MPIQKGTSSVWRATEAKSATHGANDVRFCAIYLTLLWAADGPRAGA